MQFVQRLRTIWSWLPAFRAVAETEHLPTAAHELGVVPSSLSRAVKLLEDELGVALFDRSGKGLTLNPSGRTLLDAVRGAMRLVDDAIGVAVADELRGAVAAVASSDIAHTVLVPASARVAELHPQLTVTIRVAPDDELGAMVMRGDADVAIAAAPPAHPELVATELAKWTRGVFASKDTARYVGVGASTTQLDGWPSGVDVALWTPDERSALALCERGFATIAYDEVARMAGYTTRLTRLETPAVPSRTLYLIVRRPIGTHPRTDALADAIRDVIAHA